MCCAGPCTGINTGPCITGDPDCDGDPNHTSALLASQRGVDDPLFDSGEAVLFVIDFGPDHTIDPLNKSEAVLIGKPTGLFPGQQNITHIRAAKYGLTQPHLAVGDTISYNHAAVSVLSMRTVLACSLSTHSTTRQTYAHTDSDGSLLAASVATCSMFSHARTPFPPALLFATACFATATPIIGA